MNRFTAMLSALVLGALPGLAHAGIGFTAHQGIELETRGEYVSPYGLPSVDFHQDNWLIQVQVLELIAGLTQGNTQFNLGLNYYATQDKGKVADGGWSGVFQPGVGLDFESDYLGIGDPAFDITVQGRAGMQAAEGYGFGVYVVPGLGICGAPDGTGNTDIGLVVSGALQVSVWNK